MSTLILFIAPDDRLAGWWIADDGGVTSRANAETPLPPDLPDRIVAIAPAEAMTIHVAELGSLATAQARTAARLLAAETSVAPIETQHVAVGRPDGVDRTVAIIGNGRIAAWLESLQAHGVDPDAILPAALLLPRPDSGFARTRIGAETVLRGRSAAFAEEAGLTELLVGDAAVEDFDAEPLVLAALDAPELDLRQGAFARRRRFQLDWSLARRLALLAGAIVAVTLLTGIVQTVRYGFAADRLDAEAQTLAPAAGPARLGPHGAGFSAAAGALVAAVQAVPNVELASLTYDSDGLLRATVLAPGAAEAEALRNRIRASGLTVEATPFTGENGRIRGEFRIGGR
ncbi:general secretion pathway protein GspL [Sphingomonas sp. MAH-20]|uniref:General secretion pathway protein GspL n=1 Tax=Sphingomonas horti TaxID=2682842 RepID=A0A6I4IWD5_9SPHN|nr:type II secretion system protein GspL [Sphingomonas sp. CGMCC 1.13658]MBA2920129.1 general secretion pathway protein GspL [Sphingomonas sp. CGMCC 1.13658]MVO76384.1 general secretion pathway protein GspL [Sphingomonas horti]